MALATGGLVMHIVITYDTPHSNDYFDIESGVNILSYMDGGDFGKPWVILFVLLQKGGYPN